MQLPKNVFIFFIIEINCYWDFAQLIEKNAELSRAINLTCVCVCLRFGKYRKDERLDGPKWKAEETHVSEEEMRRMKLEQERYTHTHTHTHAHTESELILTIISL